MNHRLNILSDSHLIASTAKVVSTLRRVDLVLLEHLAAIESRELHLKSGYSSLFKMCTERFRLSEASAYRRVAASRLVHKYPSVRAQLLAGEVSMCTLAVVAAQLSELPDETHRQELLSAIRGKSKSQAEEILALRKSGSVPKRRDVIRPVVPAQNAMTFRRCPEGELQKQEPSGSKIDMSSEMRAQLLQTPPHEKNAGGVSFRIAFTASQTFRDKLKRAKDFLKHKHPDGNLESILEEALDHLLKSKDLVSKRGKASLGLPANPRYIPVAVRRQVLVRDSRQCTFTAENGYRCQERAGLEFEHRLPFAKGGSSVDPENIELLCRSHNAWRARQAFAKARRLSGFGTPS